MGRSEAIEVFLTKHSKDKRIEDTNAYQMLLNDFCGHLLVGLLSLLRSQTLAIQAAAINLLAVRRPHEHHTADPIGPLIRDPDGFVMLAVTDRLAEFPLELTQPFLADAYQRFQDHLNAEDEVPAIAAMRLCLRSDFETYQEASLLKLLSMLDIYQGFEGSFAVHDPA